MRIDIPEKVNNILLSLFSKGKQAYIVGGCVRDSLLRIEPKDWDITTDALPEEVIDIFSKEYQVLDVGIQYGTVILIDEDKERFEITTFRTESDYEDNRRPSKVCFTDSLKEDLSRRDFTINAMAYNNFSGLVDFFGGRKDLANGIIKCVEDADERFKEDALRIMRAFRFMARYKDFCLHVSLISAIINNKNLLNTISKERISDELIKILKSDPSVLKDMYRTEVLQTIIPEFKDLNKCLQNHNYHYTNVFAHTLVALVKSKNDEIIRLALLLHDIGKPKCKFIDDKGITRFYGHGIASANMAKEILTRLKFSNKTINDVFLLIKYHDVDLRKKKNIRKMLNIFGPDNFFKLLDIQEADTEGQSEYAKKRKKEQHLINRQNAKEILNNGECYQIKDLSINGRDLIEELDVQPGPLMGVILNKALEHVMRHPEKNTKKSLLKFAYGLKNDPSINKIASSKGEQ